MAGWFYSPPPPQQPRPHIAAFAPPPPPPVVNNPPFALRVPIIAKSGSSRYYGHGQQYGFKYVGGATSQGAATFGAVAGAVVSASGALNTGGSHLAGSAGAVVTARAQLTNFSSITLSGPLYTGIGGIFDPNLKWPFNAPVSGSVVLYDPTFIAIASNGEISSTSNNCSAQVQYFDGTNWNEVTVYLTPFQVGYGYASASVTGSLTVGNVSAALAGDAKAIASVSAALSAIIQLAADGAAIASASGSLTTAARFAGLVSALAQVTGSLSANITLAANAIANGSAQGTLGSVGASLAADSAGVVSASGNLSIAIQLAGAAAGLVSVKANLAGPALVGSAIAVATVTGQIATGAGLAAQVAAVARALGSLSTQIRMAASAGAVVSASGSLTVDVALTETPHYLLVAPYQRRLIDSVQQRFAMQPGPLPYAEFYLRVGERNTFGIDWSEWLANRWSRGSAVLLGFTVRPSVPNGYEFVCTTAGESGFAEPPWPARLGATIRDGSVVWTCQGMANDSLKNTLSSAVWTAPAGIAASSATVLGQISAVMLDTSAATAGVDYMVENTATMSDGEVKIGQIVIKVR